MVASLEAAWREGRGGSILEATNFSSMIKIIGGVLAVLLVGVALWAWQGKQADTPLISSGENKQAAGTPSTTTDLMEQGKQAISSIRDAMQLGTKMECRFSSGEGEAAVTSTVYVDGQRFFTTATVGNVKTNALFDGETQYVWTEGSAQGMKLTKACLESMKTQATNSNTNTRDYQKEFDMAKNVQCEPMSSDSVSFALPETVTFTDQCAMMQESLKMMEQMKDKLPAGVEMPALPSLAQ